MSRRKKPEPPKFVEPDSYEEVQIFTVSSYEELSERLTSLNKEGWATDYEAKGSDEEQWKGEKLEIKATRDACCCKSCLDLEK